METDRFDALTARLAPHLTRRRSLGLLGALGVTAFSAAEIIAGKGKKKKKKKNGKKDRCASAEYACPEGSKLSCCPVAWECCPTAYDDIGACCSQGCCRNSDDCGENMRCSYGCCH